MQDLRFYGIYRGLVHSVNDPLDKGRIKVRIPQLFGDSPTEWIWPAQVTSSKYAPPAVNQGVWVMFESGNPNFPVWMGTFGFNQTAANQVYSKSPSNTELGKQFIVDTTVEKAPALDLVATLVGMSDELVSLRSRVATLESTVVSLQNQINSLS